MMMLLLSSFERSAIDGTSTTVAHDSPSPIYVQRDHTRRRMTMILTEGIRKQTTASSSSPSHDTTMTNTSHTPTHFRRNTTTTSRGKRSRCVSLRRLAPLVQMIVVASIFVFTSFSQTVVVSAFHLRINGGGPLIIDSGNNNTRWESDTPYNLGNKGQRNNRCTSQPNITFANVSTTVLRTLYCTQRFYNPSTFPPPYQFNIPVPTNHTNYIVKLLFIEFVRIYW